MKPWLTGALIIALVASGGVSPAEAKRIAGGKSAGMQRDMPARTAPDAPAGKPATPTGQAPTNAQQAAPTNAAVPATAPAAAPKRSWMGPLAGLAAGLGFAALFSHFGMGEGVANFMLIALLAVAGVFVVGFIVRRFAAGAAPRTALAGAGGAPAGWADAPPPVTPLPSPAVLARTSPEPVQQASAAAAVSRVFVPAAFDSEGFARTAKMIFIRLQAANDAADLDDLKRFTTPELFASLRLDLQERGATPQQTDVVDVTAQVLDVANEADRQVVSVRFHGQIVEGRGEAPVAFNEVWHLVKPHDDSRAWAIAGIEQIA
jgi:predicted lipid-binding transport protein (Tim44 family)